MCRKPGLIISKEAELAGYLIMKPFQRYRGQLRLGMEKNCMASTKANQRSRRMTQLTWWRELLPTLDGFAEASVGPILLGRAFIYYATLYKSKTEFYSGQARALLKYKTMGTPLHCPPLKVPNKSRKNASI